MKFWQEAYNYEANGRMQCLLSNSAHQPAAAAVWRDVLITHRIHHSMQLQTACRCKR